MEYIASFPERNWIPYDPLSITKQPEMDVSVGNGENIKVTVEARGDGLTYQWYYTSNGKTDKFFKSSNTTNTYTTMNASRNGYRIYCVVTDKYGYSVTSDTVTLTMGRQELRIITQPETQFWMYGMETAVKVQAAGDGLTYQWYYQDEGGEACPDPDNTTDTDRVIMLPAIDGRTVWCVITDQYGQQVTSDKAQMFCE